MADKVEKYTNSQFAARLIFFLAVLTVGYVAGIGHGYKMGQIAELDRQIERTEQKTALIEYIVFGEE